MFGVLCMGTYNLLFKRCSVEHCNMLSFYMLNRHLFPESSFVVAVDFSSERLFRLATKLIENIEKHYVYSNIA